jgi:hypothetical protein
MITYRLTKTFTAGILSGLTVTDTITFDGPCRFKEGQEVKNAIGGGSYRIDRVERT